MNESLYGKALKPLPPQPKPKLMKRELKGTVAAEDYERRVFQQAFKKGKP